MRFHEFNIDEGVHDPNIFKAVFMAGSPGAGKTTVAKKLFTGTGMKMLNVDDFYNLMREKGQTTGDPEQDYLPAAERMRKRRQNFLDGRLGIVVDGTAKSVAVQEEMKRELEQLGYEVAMVFVNTSLETSLERVASRSRMPGRDMGRSVDPNFVKQVWKRVQENIARLQNVFGTRFFVVNNDDQPQLDYVEKSMRNWLAQPPKSHIARKWIEANKKGA